MNNCQEDRILRFTEFRKINKRNNLKLRAAEIDCGKRCWRRIRMYRVRNVEINSEMRIDTAVETNEIRTLETNVNRKTV